MFGSSDGGEGCAVVGGEDDHMEAVCDPGVWALWLTGVSAGTMGYAPLAGGDAERWCSGPGLRGVRVELCMSGEEPPAMPPSLLPAPPGIVEKELLAAWTS